MAKVQLTIFENPIEVDDAEVAVLRAQGLLVETPAPAADAAKGKPETAGDGSKESK